MAKTSKEKEFDNIPVCLYAGDQEDEFCAECNGKTMTVDGKVFPCTECGGYTPAQECVDTPTQTDETARDDTKVATADTYTPQGITTSIKAESGLSIETKKGWYRFTYTEERIIPESADMEKEKEALWNAVNAEVDRQAEEIKLAIG